jgi:methylphosphotriester-DNA--protein-cysteine methyltransferase
VASLGSKKTYHSRSCYHVKRLPATRLLPFRDPAAAEASGYKACLDCKPLGAAMKQSLQPKS